MSTSTEEAICEGEDDRTPREREISAYHAAVKHLDPEDILFITCDMLPFQAPALLSFIVEQLREPYEDISRAHIHPDTAQGLARELLAAVAASIDSRATMRIAAQEV